MAVLTGEPKSSTNRKLVVWAISFFSLSIVVYDGVEIVVGVWLHALFFLLLTTLDGTLGKVK